VLARVLGREQWEEAREEGAAHMAAQRLGISGRDEGEEDAIHDLQVQPRRGQHHHRRILIDAITNFSNLMFEACLVEAMFHLGIPRCFTKGNFFSSRYKQLLWHRCSVFSDLLWVERRRELSDCSEEEEAVAEG
jgi:hypothetical protein